MKLPDMESGPRFIKVRIVYLGWQQVSIILSVGLSHYLILAGGSNLGCSACQADGLLLSHSPSPCGYPYMCIQTYLPKCLKIRRLLKISPWHSRTNSDLARSESSLSCQIFPAQSILFCESDICLSRCLRFIWSLFSIFIRVRCHTQCRKSSAILDPASKRLREA